MATQKNPQNQHKIDPSTENNYWKSHYNTESYYEPGRKFEDYEGAYRTGYEGYGRYGDRGFDKVENELKTDYEKMKGTSGLAWDRAKNAVEAAWHRAEHAMPGDAGRGGR